MALAYKSGRHENPIETISVLAFVCIIFGILFKIEALFYIALALLFTGIFLGNLSYRIAKLWMRFADLLGHINTRIILTAIFFLLLTPLAFIYRLFHGDSLNIKNRKVDGKSYWHNRTHIYQPKDFDNMW